MAPVQEEQEERDDDCDGVVIREYLEQWERWERLE